MISFFRRFLKSWLALGVLALVMVAFIITGVVTQDMGSIGGVSGGAVAEVDGKPIHAAEAANRVNLALDQARREQPGLDIGAFVSGGGVDATIDQLIAARAVEIWGKKQGIAASDRLVDGEIASIGAFKGPTGQFDQNAFRAALAQRRMSEKQLRDDIAADSIRRQLLLPASVSASAPTGVVTPYAALLLESRTGLIGVVPSQAMAAGNPPTDGEIATWYSRNIARYTIPERRVLRYALFGRDQLAPPKPSEAEIAAFYKQSALLYGAKETRNLSQVILPEEAAARALAAKVKGGASIADAARQAGVEAINLPDRSQDKYAAATSPSVAAAVFGAPQGSVAGPIKGALGWFVVKIDSVKSVAARPLESVRGEIAAAIEKQKIEDALSAKVTAIEDAIADGSSFDDVLKAEKLSAVTTPALLANGSAPDQPDWQAPPETALLLKAAADLTTDDDPTVETIAANDRYAVLKVDRVVPSAPAPLAKVREQVVRDFLAKRASERARAVATAIMAKANAGVPLDKAFAEAGVRLPPVERASGRQMDLSRPNQPVPPPLAMMFSMAKGKTKLLPVPGDRGWFVVQLQEVVPGNAAEAPQLVAATRQQFDRVLAEEYAAQFTAAIKKQLGVRRNDAAVAALKSQLAGGGN
jgi:peptidyl-prolyl cis-trans isomerase D